ncbi:hypothetical protein FQA39_LY18346 [Lamprigera yunnana]|nr:hypothetical protein FQA39_LY18346 [Lamprigera yunnana]
MKRMNVDSCNRFSIKSEAIIEKTSFCGDYRNQELDPLDFNEPFKYKEGDNHVERVDVNGTPVRQYTCNECNFQTAEKSSLKCNFKTLLECSIKEHLKIHNECNFNKSKLRIQKRDDKYVCSDCDYKTRWKHQLNVHMKIHRTDAYKCKECD